MGYLTRVPVWENDDDNDEDGEDDVDGDDDDLEEEVIVMRRAEDEEDSFQKKTFRERPSEGDSRALWRQLVKAEEMCVLCPTT